MSNTPEYFMKQASEIAAHIDPHQTSPNPRVGCVIVQDGEIVAQGVHERFGGLHAEQNAFQAAIDYRLPTIDLRNSEIYITLEPCDHFHGKKTPSCTDLLIAKKPRRVFVGTLDPQFRGKNIEKIRAAGIEVEVLNDGYHEKLNPFFEKYITTKKPYLTLKVAQSLDGKIGGKGKGGRGKLDYITKEKSLERVHEMRAQYSAILTTTQTILADNPRMDVRKTPSRSPWKGENTKKLLKFLPFQGRLGGVKNPDIVIVGKSELPKELKIFQIPGRKVYRFDTFGDFWESDVIKKIDSIMTECGQGLNTYLLQNDLVDQINLFIAPKVLGEGGLHSFGGECDLSDLDLHSTENLDGDILMMFKKEP